MQTNSYFKINTTNKNANVTKKKKKKVDSRASHLFPAVAVVSVKMPFDDSMRGASLTFQEGAASLYPILDHLQSVLIGCRAKTQTPTVTPQLMSLTQNLI